ncbi:MAG: cation-translocating P-type ATPase [Anaerolineales bacterium]|nr:cation-translocating P-type ATPase [Anaerolineales bacterium]
MPTDPTHLPHAWPVDALLSKLSTHLTQGLTDDEAAARLEKVGPNELQERPRPTFWNLLLGQFNNFLIIILLVSSIVSLILGEILDASAILAIVILNAVLGVVQESKAEEALAALKKMAAPEAKVLRSGHLVTVPSRTLVPGDIVFLEAGHYVPTDLRLVEAVNLKIDEASLTGESHPVQKDAQVVLDREIPLGDRKNSAFMGAIVTYGRGKGIVTATGMHTQFGLIAEMIQSYEEEPTPLQIKLDQLGHWLGIGCLVVCGIVGLLGVLRGLPLLEMFMTAVSLAIAAVPEGLPAVVTICLALGMQEMIRRNALIRRLPAVETLGSATVICSDKTGTLTQNEMMVVKGWADEEFFSISGEGYQPQGEFSRNGQTFNPLLDPVVRPLCQGMALCNDALLEPSGQTDDGHPTWRMVGDPTEGALVVAAAKAGLWKEELEGTCIRLAEVPFESERKRMTTIHQLSEPLLEHNPGNANCIAFVKGAPDLLLERCTHVLTGQGIRELNRASHQNILSANETMTLQALRVLGVACQPMKVVPDKLDSEMVERDLTFIGLMGMIDPARSEVKQAVQVAKRAGLKSVMVTGDYPQTALAIAKELDLLSPSGLALTGAQLDEMDQDSFTGIIEQVDVFARVSPQHKVRIVEGFKRRGHVVAMTGDGVNDAPALKRADIGVAMGITGTDVSKETADMVLTDDNFASIVSAIEEGRIIYSNIRKFVFYLLSCNVGEILVIFIAMLVKLPVPLKPIQLLWLNLVTDGAPAIALGLEKGDSDIMRLPPRPTNEPVINRDMRWGIIIQSIAITVTVLAAFLYGLRQYPENLVMAQTLAFVTLTASELLRAFTSRSEYHSVLSIGLFSNMWLVMAFFSSLALLIAVLYIPFLQTLFSTIPLGWYEWLVISPLILIPSVAAELTKLVLRRTKGFSQAL